MFGRFCQNNPCFIEQERAQEIEVPAMYHLQQSINQLPPFEPHRPLKNCNKNGVVLRSALPECPKTTSQHLKKIRSQQNLGLLSLATKGKENYGSKTGKKYNFTCNSAHQQGQQTTNNQFKQEIYNYSYDGLPDLPQRVQQSFIGNHSMMYSTTMKPRQPYESDSTVVSMEEFNRLVHMNLNLIQIIQQDYQPLRESCWNLEKQQVEKGQLIESLEKKVRELKRQLGSRDLAGSHHRFY